MMHNHEDARHAVAVDPHVLKPLFKIQSYKHGIAIAYNWIIILATAYLCIQFFNPFSYILAVLIIGARMHALAILMHDASHFRFMKNRKWNDTLTNFTIMYPIFSSVAKYRLNHLRHHRHLNTEHDPDWVAKLGRREFTFPKSRQEFILSLLSYFFLYQGIRDGLWLIGRINKTISDTGKKVENKTPYFIFLIVLFTILTLTGGWTYYLLFWIVPFLSTFFMFQYIRSVAEHFGELAYENDLNSTRTVKTNLFEQFFIAPHNVGFHLEHHLYPGVPFYNLPKLHKALMQNEAYKKEAHLTQGYMVGLMKELRRTA